MKPTINLKDLKAEILTLHRLLRAAAREARHQDKLVDALSAALLRAGLLVRKIQRGKSR